MRVGHGTAKINGKIKEAAGSATGSDELRREGQSQQHKGHHEQQAAKAHAVAEKHEREAELFEHEERGTSGRLTKPTGDPLA